MKQRKPGCICELDEKTVEPIVSNYEMCPVHKPDAPDPKKEAARLIDEFSLTVDGAVSKECALIAVGEIMKVLPMYTGILNPDWIFWSNVREEIKLL